MRLKRLPMLDRATAKPTPPTRWRSMCTSYEFGYRCTWWCEWAAIGEGRFSVLTCTVQALSLCRWRIDQLRQMNNWTIDLQVKISCSWWIEWKTSCFRWVSSKRNKMWWPDKHLFAFVSRKHSLFTVSQDVVLIADHSIVPQPIRQQQQCH